MFVLIARAKAAFGRFRASNVTQFTGQASCKAEQIFKESLGIRRRSKVTEVALNVLGH